MARSFPEYLFDVILRVLHGKLWVANSDQININTGENKNIVGDHVIRNKSYGYSGYQKTWLLQNMVPGNPKNIFS